MSLNPFLTRVSILTENGIIVRSAEGKLNGLNPFLIRASILTRGWEERPLVLSDIVVLIPS